MNCDIIEQLFLPSFNESVIISQATWKEFFEDLDCFQLKNLIKTSNIIPKHLILEEHNVTKPVPHRPATDLNKAFFCVPTKRSPYSLY